MQITETSSEGLKRTLQVVVPRRRIGKRFSDRLDEMKDRVQLKGFRKGKVPVPHLKKMYGRSLMVEVLQDAVRETSNQALADRKLRPAMQPSVTLPEDQSEIERVLSGEPTSRTRCPSRCCRPSNSPTSRGLKLERLVAEVDDEAIDKALGQLVDRGVTFTPDEDAQRRDGRPRDRRLRRYHRRRSLRRRHRRSSSDRPWPGQLHPRL